MANSYDTLVHCCMVVLVVVAPTLEIAQEHIQIIREISRAGLTINYEKSELTPKPVIIFLGVKIDL